MLDYGLGEEADIWEEADMEEEADIVRKRICPEGF
jgi:hypothetical protein